MPEQQTAHPTTCGVEEADALSEPTAQGKREIWSGPLGPRAGGAAIQWTLSGVTASPVLPESASRHSALNLRLERPRLPSGCDTVARTPAHRPPGEAPSWCHACSYDVGAPPGTCESPGATSSRTLPWPRAPAQGVGAASICGSHCSAPPDVCTQTPRQNCTPYFSKRSSHSPCVSAVHRALGGGGQHLRRSSTCLPDPGPALGHHPCPVTWPPEAQRLPSTPPPSGALLSLPLGAPQSSPPNRGCRSLPVRPVQLATVPWHPLLDTSWTLRERVLTSPPVRGETEAGSGRGA